MALLLSEGGHGTGKRERKGAIKLEIRAFTQGFEKGELKAESQASGLNLVQAQPSHLCTASMLRFHDFHMSTHWGRYWI
jgi:hypothetical protein